MADVANSDNWKKRWDLPSSDVAFLEGMIPGCGMEAPGFEVWIFHQNTKLLLNWVGQPGYLRRQGGEQGGVRLRLGHGKYFSAL